MSYTLHGVANHVNILAFNTASANARRNNAVYCRIFTSTPGDLDTQPGQDALQIIEKTCKWTEKFYDMTKDEIDDYITKNSGNGIVYIEYQYYQLGDDEEWLKRVSQTLLNNPIKIKREVFLQRMRGSSESPFDQEELQAIQELKKPIKEEIFINKLYKLDIYQPLKRDRIYIVGVDCAQGLGEDNTAVTVLDPYLVEPVAEFKSPYIGISDAIKFLYTLVRKHIPKAILAIERNNVGEAIIDGLRQTEVRANLYFDDSKDFFNIDDKLDPQGFLKREAARRKLYGVWTGSKSRDIMLAILEAHVKEYKDKFVTENIINDLLSLVRKKNGKIGHAPGFHDDSLFSYLIALYVYYHGKNLHRFGFVRGQLPDDENRNKGLVYEEIIEEMPEELKQQFSDFSVKTMDDYEKKIRSEIEAARREMSHIDTLLNPVNSAENFDEFENDAYIPLSLFDELNS